MKRVILIGLLLVLTAHLVLAQDMGERGLRPGEKPAYMMKYHKLRTPLAKLAWRAENETELREKWVNAEVEIGLRNASKDLSVYEVNITGVFRAPDERNIDKVYGYVKIGALAGLQKDPDIFFVQIPVPPEPGVVREVPGEGKPGEAAFAATSVTAGVAALLLLFVLALGLWRRKIR